MLKDLPRYSIIFPEGFSQKPREVQKEGILDNITVELDNNRSYRLLFMDFYRFAEEFGRAVNYYKQEWFSRPGLVIVSKITPEAVKQAIITLLEQNYFAHLSALSGKECDPTKDLPQAKIIFPEWYANDPQTQLEYEDKGTLNDVIVQLSDTCKYKVSFEDFVSFTQTFAESARIGEVYSAEPGRIIVSSVKPDLMESAIKWLVTQNYFEHLKPIT